MKSHAWNLLQFWRDKLHTVGRFEYLPSRCNRIRTRTRHYDVTHKINSIVGNLKGKFTQFLEASKERLRSYSTFFIPATLPLEVEVGAPRGHDHWTESKTSFTSMWPHLVTPIQWMTESWWLSSHLTTASQYSLPLGPFMVKVCLVLVRYFSIFQ